MICTIPAARPALGEEPAARVLLVYSTPHGFSMYDEFQEAFAAAVRAGGDRRVEIYTEFLDVMTGHGDGYEPAVFAYLREKYAGEKIDVVVGVSGPAVRFASRLRTAVFPDSVFAYGAVDRRVIDAGAAPPDAIGVSSDVDLGGTIDIALQCVPGTRHIALVLGATELEVNWRRFPVEEIARRPGLDLIDLTALEEPELMRRLSQLPDHTVVLWIALYRDATGAVVNWKEALSRANSATSAPIFGVFSFQVGSGIVGGSLADFSRSGDETGRLVQRLLRGEPPSAIGRVHVPDHLLAFDARELDRWGIPDSRLPAGAEVLNREVPAWRRYGGYVVAAAVVILVQTLLISALFVESRRRRRNQRILEAEIDFEAFVSGLSSRLADTQPDGIVPVIADALDSARQLLGVARLSLVSIDGASDSVAVLSSATAPGVPETAGRVAADRWPDLIELLREGYSVDEALARAGSTTESPGDAPSPDGVRTVAAAPLHTGGKITGMLAAGETQAEPAADDTVSDRLGVLADIISNALGRQRASARLRRSEELSHAVLASITARVCVVDGSGAVVAGNDAWHRAASGRDHDVACTLTGYACGASCGDPGSCTAGETQRLRDGIRAVIAHEMPSFSMESCVTDGSEEWYVTTVEPLRLREGGAVISSQNVTDRKRAELEAEQRRQQLTHVSRVSAMGELAASIAHELKQPLTGVLANAQAGLRYLESGNPNVPELREILSDIIEDDRRAGEVINRMRTMLQEGAVESRELDVADVIRTVLKMFASDALLRGISLESDLETASVRVVGDRVQLQQVVLNLVANAMDAVESARERRISVRAEVSDADMVTVSVTDSGPGIQPERLERIFAPFFTTKSDGLGMGLPIARTIVESHGGRLWATPGAAGGVCFSFSIPAAPHGTGVPSAAVDADGTGAGRDAAGAGERTTAGGDD